MCVIGADADVEPAHDRRLFCDVCSTTATAAEFVPEDKRADRPEDPTDALPDWSEVT
jgi:hypothetical protein